MKNLGDNKRVGAARAAEQRKAFVHLQKPELSQIWALLAEIICVCRLLRLSWREGESFRKLRKVQSHSGVKVLVGLKLIKGRIETMNIFQV